MFDQLEFASIDIKINIFPSVFVCEIKKVKKNKMNSISSAVITIVKKILRIKMDTDFNKWATAQDHILL